MIRRFLFWYIICVHLCNLRIRKGINMERLNAKQTATL